MVVAGVKGSLAAGIELIYDTLMVSALDEVSTEYGLLAEAVSHPDDHSSVTYRLRANAQVARRQAGDRRGRDLLVRGLQEQPSAMLGLLPPRRPRRRRPASARSPSPSTAPGNRELPQIVGQLTVLPKHWWEGTDKAGNKRDVTATTLEPPLGCGAYRLKEFVPGRSHRLRAGRRTTGARTSTSISAATISTSMRFEYFRDSTVALEAFKADRSTGAPRTAPRTGPPPTTSRR